MNKFVLFDFDGVIVDNFEMAYQFNAKVGFDITRDQYRDMFMGNVYDSLRKRVPEDEWKMHNKQWFEMYSPEVLKQRLQSGIGDTIKNLAQKYKLIIISSSITSPIRSFLELHKLESVFEKIYGSDVHESKEVKVNQVFSQYKTSTEDCIFITDTVGDVSEMKRVGVDSIAVLWGFHDKERFDKVQPIAFADTAEELVNEIDKYFNQVK